MFSQRYFLPNIILTSLALIIIAIFIFRKVAEDYKEKGRLSILSTVLEFVIFFLHGMSSYIFLDSDINKINLGNPLPLLGLFLMIFGLIFTIVSMAGLGFKKSCGQTVDSLAILGFYKYSRNPQIVFYGFVIIGYALLWPSWSGIIWIVLYFIIAHIMVKTEEIHLLRVHGKEYRRYCEQTPRYINFPKKNR